MEVQLSSGVQGVMEGSPFWLMFLLNVCTKAEGGAAPKS